MVVCSGGSAMLARYSSLNISIGLSGFPTGTSKETRLRDRPLHLSNTELLALSLLQMSRMTCRRSQLIYRSPPADNYYNLSRNNVI